MAIDGNVFSSKQFELYIADQETMGTANTTDAEFMQLESYLGMSNSELSGYDYYRGTDEGVQLKHHTMWNGTNTSGFSALGAGELQHNGGQFMQHGNDYGWFWTSTSYNEEQAIWRELASNQTGIRRSSSNFNAGYSVRCIYGE